LQFLECTYSLFWPFPGPNLFSDKQIGFSDFSPNIPRLREFVANRSTAATQIRLGVSSLPVRAGGHHRGDPERRHPFLDPMRAVAISGDGP
jgi:hypothetical protein